MAFSAAPPNDELLASALEDSAQLEPLPLSHDASVNGTAMASMMRAAGCSDAGDAALPGFKHWHESKDALPQAITHEGFLSDGEHW